MSYFSVDGPIPAIRLGFAGAPLCTVLSHNVLAIMLMIYIVQHAIREEVEYLRGLNTIPDEPVSVSRNYDRPTGGNHASGPPQDHSGVTFFAGLGTLVFAGISGVLKSASQLWSKDFGGGEPMFLESSSSFLTTSQSLQACMISTCAYGEFC